MSKRKHKEIENDNFTLDLMPLNWQKYTPHRTNVLIGPKGSGKTYLVRDIVAHFPIKFDFTLCFYGTMGACEDMQKIFPSECVWPLTELDRGFLSRFTTKLDDLRKKRTKEKKRLYNHLLFLDDCSFNKQMFNWKEWNNLAYQGRHYNLTIFITCQDPMDLPRNIRTNADYIWVKRYKPQNTIERLFELYFSTVFEGQLERFVKVYTIATEDRGTLVIDNCTTESALNKQVFYYDCSITPETKIIIGRFPLWYMHYKRIKLDDDIIDNTRILEKSSELSLEQKIRKITKFQ